jgi:hypothetical protein
MPTKLLKASDVQYKVNNGICQSLGENRTVNEKKIADNRCNQLLESTPTGRWRGRRDRMAA